MDAKQLQEIKERAEAATKGPWRVGNQNGFWGQNCVIEADDKEIGLVVVADVVHTSALEDVCNKTFIAHARQDVPALLSEVERLQAALASEQAEARNEIDALMSKLVNVSEANETLARDLIRTKGEVAGLRLRVKAAQDVADELAGLVCRFINTFSAIRHRVSDDIKAVIDAAMKGVDVPEDKPEDTVADVIERRISRVFEDIGGGGETLSPLELFRAQRTMVSAWRKYVNGGGDGQPA